jgi:hypothetical protein
MFKFDLNSNRFANYKKIGIENGFFIYIRPWAESCFYLENGPPSQCLAWPIRGPQAVLAALPYFCGDRGIAARRAQMSSHRIALAPVHEDATPNSTTLHMTCPP